VLLGPVLEESMDTAKLRLDSEALFEAIDRERRHRRMKRKDVAAILGVAACTFTLWGGGGGIGSDAALRACVWLGRDLRDFAKKDGD
jgi:hypothetical protein